MWRIVKIILSVLIPAGFVGVLIVYVDFNYFISEIKDVNSWYLIISFICLFAAYFFRVGRFMILFSSKKVKQLFAISSLHYFFNRILPARTGEATLPVLLKKYLNISYSKGITGLVFIRVIDLYGILLVLFLSIIGITDHEWQRDLVIIFRVIAIFIIIASLLLFIFPRRVLGFTRRSILILTRFGSSRFQLKIRSYVDRLNDFINKMPRNFIPGIVLMSFGSWLLIYLYYYFIVRAFGLPYPFAEVSFASSISNFTLVLPLSAVGNLGTFEAGWTAGFSLLGMDAGEAVQIGLFSNIYATLITSLLALVGWLLLKFRSHN